MEKGKTTYKSPITIIESTIDSLTQSIIKQKDDAIFAEIQHSFGVDMDKEELIRALKYDRDQYEKGYADGKADATPKWIPVTERLPKNDYGKHWKERKHYLVSLAPSGLMRVAHYGYKEYDWWIDEHDCVLSATNFKEVTHWMEINNFPQPPKG